jgi:hypothetical protein
MANDTGTERQQTEKEHVQKRLPDSEDTSAKPKTAKRKSHGVKAKEPAKPEKKKQETVLHFHVPAHVIAEMKIEVWDEHGRKRVGTLGKDEKQKIDKQGKASFPVSPGTYVVRYFVNGKLKDWQTVRTD